MKKIVLTGPESTGKSNLAKALSKHFKSPIVDEFAVEYLDMTHGRYDYKDLVKIAKGQIKKEDEVTENNNSNLIIIDTDLITIKIWSKVKYKKVNRWIMEAIRARNYDLYLLCKPDIPWEFSEYRENPNDRDRLFTFYEKELRRYKKNYITIEGLKQTRIENAIKAIDNLRDK